MGLTSFLYHCARCSADCSAVSRGHTIHRLGSHLKGRVLARAGFWRWLWR